MEIVDLPTKHSDSPVRYANIYQRVCLMAFEVALPKIHLTGWRTITSLESWPWSAILNKLCLHRQPMTTHFDPFSHKIHVPQGFTVYFPTCAKTWNLQVPTLGGVQQLSSDDVGKTLPGIFKWFHLPVGPSIPSIHRSIYITNHISSSLA